MSTPDKQSRYLVSIDIGASNGGSIKFGIRQSDDLTGQHIRPRLSSPALKGLDPVNFFSAVIHELREYLKDLHIRSRQIDQIILGFPSKVDRDGVAINAPNLQYVENGELRSWKDIPIKKIFESQLGWNNMKVIVVNDIVPGVADVLERIFRPGDKLYKTRLPMLYVFPGTGCGAAEASELVVGGRSNVLIKPVESGHVQRTPKILHHSTNLPPRSSIELGFTSSQAIEKNFRGITGRRAECQEIISLAGENRDNNCIKCLELFAEGISLLVEDAFTRGIKSVVLDGKLSFHVDDALVRAGRKSLLELIEQQVKSNISRHDFLEDVQFLQLENRSNARGSVWLSHCSFDGQFYVASKHTAANSENHQEALLV